MFRSPFRVYFIVMDSHYCVHFFSIAPKTSFLRICLIHISKATRQEIDHTIIALKIQAEEFIG